MAHVTADERREPPSAGGFRLQPFLIASVPLVGLATLQQAVPVFAPMLTRSAGVSPEAYGWIGGALGLGSVWLFMANSAFTVALGPVRAWRIAALIGLTGAALVLTGQFTLMLLGALLIGFAYATSTPAGSQILADHTPARYRVTLFSLRQAGVPAGGVLAGGCGWLIAQFGWRPAFLLVAAATASLCSLLLIAPARFNSSRPLRPFRLSGLFAVSNLLEPFRIVTATPGMLRFTAACAGFAAMQGATNSFFVTHMTAGLGFALSLAGAMFALMQAFSVMGRAVLGIISDWVGSPRPVLKALALLSCFSGLLLASIERDWSTAQLVAAMAVSGLSIATWNGLYLAEVATMAPDRVSEATAATTFFVFATYMVTPPIAGIVSKFFGFRAAFVLAAIAAATAFAVLSFAGRNARMPPG